MNQTADIKRKRGRPPKTENADFRDTRETLITVGLSVLTEKGYSSTGIDEILRKAGVPKGSFYHYFDNKEAFGRILIEAYGRYFARKLDRWFEDRALTPLQRLEAFVEDAKTGMARFEYLEARTLRQAISMLQRCGDQARLVAGSTDFLVRWRLGAWQPKYVINLQHIPALQRVSYSSRNGLRLGGLVTVQTLETHQAIRRHYPALATGATSFAGVQIRNLATVGGNGLGPGQRAPTDEESGDGRSGAPRHRDADPGCEHEVECDDRPVEERHGARFLMGWSVMASTAASCTARLMGMCF